VRELSLVDALWIGIGIGENIPVGLPLIFGLFVFLFPNADIFSALVVGFLANLAVAALFGMMGAAMPRSGGDYVWTSRVLGPITGFATNFAYFIFLLAAAIGFVMFQFSGYFLSTAFQIQGALVNQPGLVSLGVWLGTPMMSFALGSAVLLAMLLISIFGLRLAKKFLGILTIITVVGTFAAIYLFATTTNQQFITEFNNYHSILGTTYQQVMTVAGQNGWSSVAPTMIGAFFPLVYTFNMYGGFNFQAYNAGEIKHVTRNLPLSIFIALGTGLVMWGALGYLVPVVLGHDFFQAINYLYFNNPTAYSAAVTQPPSLTLFIDIMSINNPALFWTIFIGFFCSYAAFILAYFQVLPRIIFSWSFDRVVSGGLSKVNEKLNTPVRALVLSFVLSELCVAIYSFSSWVFSFVNFTLIAGVVNIPWGLAGLLFPYMRKEMFDNAPSIVRKKVAGIPVISIIGLAVIIIGFFSVYFDLLTPAYSGPVGQEYIILTALPFIAPAAIYLVSKSYHKSHGIDLSLAFKQIPPE